MRKMTFSKHAFIAKVRLNFRIGENFNDRHFHEPSDSVPHLDDV